MPVCLAAGAALVTLPVSAFVLSWAHSVERTVWREDWRVVADTLVLDEARVPGSGAGMEPPVDARLIDGTWRYRPSLPPLQRLRLAHSEFASDYSLCWSDKCELLATLLDRGRADAVDIFPCAGSETSATAADAASVGATEVTK
jgi:hypothetical protein